MAVNDIAPQTEPKVLVPKARTGPDSQTHRAHAKRLQMQKERFDEMKHEDIRIRPDSGAQWVQVNGYAFSIAASGEYVSVPTQVADMLRAKGVI